MKIQDNAWYSKDHEWVRIEGGTAIVGISDHAQEQLGDITFVELPAVGKQVKQGGEVATIESVKAASDVYAPVGGTVATVNEALGDQPELVNKDAYGAGWICTLSGVDQAELKNLMTAEQYAAFAKGQ